MYNWLSWAIFNSDRRYYEKLQDTVQPEEKIDNIRYCPHCKGILNDDTSLKRLPKIEKKMVDLHRRKEKLLDLRLDNNIDRVVFESVVEKIDIGGYNDEGVEDSLKITNFSRF